MSDVLTAAAVQLQCADDVGDNLARVSRWVDAAAAAGARLILLPENFAFFGSEKVKPQHAEDLAQGGPIVETLTGLCRRHEVTVIAGGFPERSAEAARPYNTSAVFGPDGQLRAKYRKIHLFDVELPDGRELKESNGTSPGDEVVLVDVEGFRVALSICYDLRFSRLFDLFSQRGADVVTVPAAFTLQTGKDHWHVLLRARAIEAQCWVLAAGQWGKHPGDRQSYGHSMIVDPWGTVVSDCSDREGFVVHTLDKEYLQAVRSRIPCAAHRRDLA